LPVLFDKFFTYSQWFIAYRKRKRFRIPFDTDDFQMIDCPPGRFYADPFVMKYNGKNYIFFEDFCFVRGRGVISFIEIDEYGKQSEPVVVLQKTYHLSYPFLFTWNNKIFMIPETGQNQTIELYVAVNFPYDWELEKILMKDINAYDTTIWFSKGKAWLFTNTVQQGRPRCTDLSLFCANTIFDDWQAHPKNPIVSDITNSRPAGNLFIYNGEVIRPSQNSFDRYGQALVFNKITCLTEHDYQEVKIDEIHPNWYPENLCCHTYNGNEEIEVIDGLLTNKNVLNLYRKMVWRIRNNLVTEGAK